MSGIRTEPRKVALERLARRTAHEIDQARSNADVHNLPKLRLLAARLDQEIALETAREVALSPRKPRADHVGDRLQALGVTAHEVKEWAVTQGLVDRGRRGRIRSELVEAYAETVEARKDAIAAHGTGDECRDCGQPMIRSPYWIAHPEKREQWKTLGLARQGGRGLCCRCYVRLQNHGQLDNHPTITATGEHCCTRCGIKRIAADLCDDCTDVLALDHSRKASA